MLGMRLAALVRWYEGALLCPRLTKLLQLSLPHNEFSIPTGRHLILWLTLVLDKLAYLEYRFLVWNLRHAEVTSPISWANYLGLIRDSCVRESANGLVFSYLAFRIDQVNAIELILIQSIQLFWMVSVLTFQNSQWPLIVLRAREICSSANLRSSQH